MSGDCWRLEAFSPEDRRGPAVLSALVGLWPPAVLGYGKSGGQATSLLGTRLLWDSLRDSIYFYPWFTRMCCPQSLVGPTSLHSALGDLRTV